MMKNTEAKQDIFQQLSDQKNSFKMEAPVHGWKRIESKLDHVHSKKQISFYKIFYNAAVWLAIIGALAVVYYYARPYNIDQNSEADLYAMSIIQLEPRHNTYPVYDVHKLMTAYQKLQISRPGSGETDEILNDIRIGH